MPVYDFTCKQCNKKFSLTLSIKDFESKKYKCPKCGSKKVEQRIASFYAITSKKS